MLQIVLLALGVILLCTAHLAVGFFVGYRLGPQRNVPAGTRESVPSYFPALLDLIERSQQLHLQTSAFAQELPEKLVQAVARLMESAESLNKHLAGTAFAALEGGERITGGKRPQGRGRKQHWKPVGKPPSSVEIPDAPGQTLDCTTKLTTVHSELYPSHALEADDQLDDSHLAMTDMMNFVVRANREAKMGTTSDVRYPYPTQQFVAFYDGTLPAPEEFIPVQCLDVSASGISFLLPHRPASEALIISLGKTPQLQFMVAHVANHRYMLADGKEGYRVGCKFLKRLELSIYAWDPAAGRIIGEASALEQKNATDMHGAAGEVQPV
jgi:hypothetical protein